jgi:hypothetical protein
MSQVAPPLKFRAVGADGLALVGGKLYTYTAGTSTPKDTYTSYALSASNTNPVILDARGEADLWLDGNYKFILKDWADATIWTVDEVHDLTSNQTFTGTTLAGTLTVTSTAVTWSGNPTHSGNHTFTNNVVVNGNTTLGDSSADALTIKPNAVTWTNNPTHSGNHTFSGTVAVTGAVTFTAIPAGKVTSGTYTPTLTGIANIISVTNAGAFQWLRVGDTVTVSGIVLLDPNAATTLTQIAISLPLTSTFALFNQCAGSAVQYVIGLSGTISGDTSSPRAYMHYTTTAEVAAQYWMCHFTYLIV